MCARCRAARLFSYSVPRSDEALMQVGPGCCLQCTVAMQAVLPGALNLGVCSSVPPTLLLLLPCPSLSLLWPLPPHTQTQKNSIQKRARTQTYTHAHRHRHTHTDTHEPQKTERIGSHVDYLAKSQSEYKALLF